MLSQRHHSKPDTLSQCRFNVGPPVFDVGPTLNPHWFNVLSFLSCVCRVGLYLIALPHIHMTQPPPPPPPVPIAFITRHSSNAVSMLGHRLRRWPNIETALGVCIVFAGATQLSRDAEPCWFDVGPAS